MEGTEADIVLRTPLIADDFGPRGSDKIAQLRMSGGTSATKSLLRWQH
jgi:hypothetical protein